LSLALIPAISTDTLPLLKTNTLVFIERQRLLQLVEERRDLHKGPLAVIVRICLGLSQANRYRSSRLCPAPQEKAELGVIIDILAVLFH
jgi:hypothetical protein